MMMSPLSVSQFLPPPMRFDLVIFDEASQVKPADAITVIACIAADNSSSLVTRSSCPQHRFAKGSTTTVGMSGRKTSSTTTNRCSMSLRVLVHSAPWHYRSQHEDLITYSNYSVYRGQLITFPSANIHGPDLGVELFVVAGVYRRGGARDNPIEAAKVVERVLFHVRQHPHLSIGVVAFSEAQASTIENEILRSSDECPELRVMLDGDRLHGGFVKP
jgi:hypothetical protein